MLLVRQDPVESASSGGIAFSETKVAQDILMQDRGTVMSIGENAWNDEPTPRCKVGDRIIFRQMAGHILAAVEGPDRYRIINDKDVYGVLEQISA